MNMPLLLAEEKQEEVVVVRVTEEQLLTLSADSLFNSIFDAQTGRYVMQCEAITYLGAAGIRILANLVRRLRKLGGDLKLVGVKPSARRVIAWTGLDRVCEIYEEEEEAVLSYHLIINRLEREMLWN